jgi:signal transduction histidine kinase
MLEQEKELLQLRLAVATPTQGHLDTDAEPALDTLALLPDSGNEASSTRSTNGLLAALTHDLDAPMASIIEQTELFVSSTANKLDTRQSELLRRVQAATERMQSMLHNLSSLSEIKEGTLTLQPASVDMSKVIEVALDRSKFRLEEKELQARLEIGVLPTLMADPEYMQQVIDNLVSYVCRSSRPGTTIGIRAHARDEDAGARQLHITISDDGPLRTTEAPQAVPRPIRHANSVTETDSGESRADLETAKALVEAHQGQIRCEEQPGGSTIFYLAVPIAPAQTIAHQGAEGA